VARTITTDPSPASVREKAIAAVDVEKVVKHLPRLVAKSLRFGIGVRFLGDHGGQHGLDVRGAACIAPFHLPLLMFETDRRVVHVPV
jgi:hypothetical protein